MAHVLRNTVTTPELILPGLGHFENFKIDEDLSASCHNEVEGDISATRSCRFDRRRNIVHARSCGLTAANNANSLGKGLALSRELRSTLQHFAQSPQGPGQIILSAKEVDCVLDHLEPQHFRLQVGASD